VALDFPAAAAAATAALFSRALWEQPRRHYPLRLLVSLDFPAAAAAATAALFSRALFGEQPRRHHPLRLLIFHILTCLYNILIKLLNKELLRKGFRPFLCFLIRKRNGNEKRAQKILL
jgi:hypothetical protein